jgi:hypothetical protein
VARDIRILKNVVFGGRAQNFCRPLYGTFEKKKQKREAAVDFMLSDNGF